MGNSLSQEKTKTTHEIHSSHDWADWKVFIVEVEKRELQGLVLPSVDMCCILPGLLILVRISTNVLHCPDARLQGELRNQVSWGNKQQAPQQNSKAKLLSVCCQLQNQLTDLYSAVYYSNSKTCSDLQFLRPQRAIEFPADMAPHVPLISLLGPI